MILPNLVKESLVLTIQHGPSKAVVEFIEGVRIHGDPITGIENRVCKLFQILAPPGIFSQLLFESNRSALRGSQFAVRMRGSGLRLRELKANIRKTCHRLTNL